MIGYICWLANNTPRSPEPSPAELFLLAAVFFAATVWLLV